MRGAIYHKFGNEITIQDDLDDPQLQPDGVIIQVKATGICRSDWHGWRGHDADIKLPHVPGHELAGIVTETGRHVRGFRRGDRVTLPFVCGCGRCPQCLGGNHHICDNQFQPGFTHWGSFAELVAIQYADVNLVAIPEGMSYSTAASLGCRFATAFRAVVHQGLISEGKWLTVTGCGGVGLSAVMIGAAFGARVIAVDSSDDALQLAARCGAEILINANDGDTVKAIQAHTEGGSHIGIEAIGSPSACRNSILSLRKGGRHIQVGLLPDQPERSYVPMDRVIAYELEILGSHGMQAHRYPELMAMIHQGLLDPSKLIQQEVNLSAGVELLTRMEQYSSPGISMITRF